MTEPGTRAERKERTRQALIEGTLELLRDRSFASVSLREVSRSAGIVPTAFYRHFASMEDLGVALVEDSMRMLRQMLRDARKDPSVKNASESLRILVRQVRNHEEQFRFLARERYGGVTEVRRAFATELRMFVSELTIDLARMPGLRAWNVDDLEMAADLIVSTMLTAAEGLLEIDRPGSRKEQDLVRRTEQQVRLVVLGMGAWKPDHSREDRS
ncbi:TetR family transcriptional regulator [Rhodococcus sp. BP-252]|uniref:TetR family transcriptional regulator n=1 Tax=unclassified Rhodococcus (in: high G+C Gram-positive bacteria) TaxID=192944 RepID=UPI000DF4ABC7|nr:MULTISPECIES: TetR family transcriptional regulator [unclassified Rhodococcus (in: high G+C Gram-positive bacteria)]MBY6412134.1 TetR family transcriptional regulator [Rhodococcus sp. BP-320]MBY6416714.1 TetR family transcriptional regulator [Rhodococcus sp. BP-321]MBY6421097.1 TetR family transcriptional regulator [Rhodococcus sp. BP-324]MBY6426738.1 TetR family transcriptional regulator [Rhodococcus sp. BP-323]MBY6431737.1 TetR family transcriptional regulator [Rhodococcus sp. BP-322]